MMASRFVAALGLALVGGALCGAQPAGEVDQRPLDVQIVPAFPELQWPDWLTGADTGLVREARPLLATGAGDGTNRLFVVTQPGTIHVFDNDPAVDRMETFIDLRDRVHYRVPQENEEGLLGLAFHPKFRDNGQFFVYYTGAYQNEQDRRSVISRFRVDPHNPQQADPDSEEILLEIPGQYWNHNGGTIIFGPDGYLYVGLGDGGLAGDPHKHGQDLQTLWGSILRLDVDRTEDGLAYAIPADNPFVGQGDARGEIWAYGIRNIWRMAFDPETGQLWAGDVGQDKFEEINLIRKGENYGWNLREGFHPFGPQGSGPREDLVEPIWEYDRADGKSITGGHVYRGEAVPELGGGYLYADFVTGKMWALWYDHDAQRVVANRQIADGAGAVMSFGEDDAGEALFMTQDGGIFRFAPAATSAAR